MLEIENIYRSYKRREGESLENQRQILSGDITASQFFSD
jgi:hypothetical protein